MVSVSYSSATVDMTKLHHRQRVFAFVVLLLSLSVTTVLWSSTNIMSNVSLVESTAAATMPNDDTQGTIPENVSHLQQHDPIGYTKNISKKRPWHQPDLTFTLKKSADDASSSTSSRSRSRSGTQNTPDRKVEDRKEDEKLGKEGEDQSEEEEDDDDAKEETQSQIRTKRTKAEKKTKTKTKKKKKKKRTMRKKKRKSDR